MRTFPAVVTALAVTLAFDASCLDREEAAEIGKLGILQAALSFDSPTHDVTHVQVEVVLPHEVCGSDAPLQQKTVPIETENLPAWLGTTGDAHPFADALFVLPPGDYRVCVTPLAQAAPSDYCASAEGLASVTAGQTTETVIFAQCSATPNGGVDVVAGLNDPPHIDGLELLPGKFIWACDLATIAMAVTDPNGDELSYRLEVLEEPDGGLYTLPTDGPDFAVKLCTPGPWLLRATTTDSKGASASLDFPVHIIGAECPGEGGRCHNPNGSPGCNDVACCQRVCHESRGCCQAGGWNLECAALAGQLCQGDAFQRGQFIDAPVVGLDFITTTLAGVTAAKGMFHFLTDQEVAFSIGGLLLGTAKGDRRVSPLDLLRADSDDMRSINMARVLQSLDTDGQPHNEVVISDAVKFCVDAALAALGVVDLDWADDVGVDAFIDETIAICAAQDVVLTEVSAADAKDHLDNTLSQSGIFRKNISKSEDWVKDAHAIGVVEVYLPPLRSNGDPSLCADDVTQGVPYERWLDPTGVECDPRESETGCSVVEVECRDIAKPLVSIWQEAIDIHSSNHADFEPDRWAYDIFVGVSRDDGATWKRTNLSRMADLSSFELETTGEEFPGFSKTPRLAIVDNKVLIAWTSTYCKSGNPRYSINVCPPDQLGCLICKGGDDGTQTCEPDYPGDDAYYVEDIWGVAGSQQSVNFDEVDDVATMGIGEIPYSCLWTARGVIVTQKELDEGRFASLVREDDPTTPDIDEGRPIGLGDIVWYKPERLTSARRDAYIPTIAGARGVGFAMAWQEDPAGLRPGKGKGPGEGWSGAISNHKTDIWYSHIAIADFDLVDEAFIPGGEPDADRTGVGRPKALVPMALPVRISDNDMVNTDTLKVQMDADGLPLVDPVTGTFIPVDPLELEHGNGDGTRRYAYLAKQDPRYAYAWDTLELCDTSGENALTELLPDSTRPRWYRFINNSGATKTVCITADGRLLDGDVSASRPNLSLLGYVHPDGTVTGYVMLAYEETKGLGDSPIHTETGTTDPTDPDAADPDDGTGEPHAIKPDKQDLGKNVVYHTFQIDQPDLVAPGHIVNLPALCGGLYPEWCDDPANPTCTCTAGEPVPVYFNDPTTGLPNPANFMQYRTEIARRTRFIAQMNTRMGPSRTIAVILYKQGQEGQGRPADVYGRRIVVPEGDVGNPYRFENVECPAYLDETWPTLPGYYHNVWGEPTGDRLCGGYYTDPIYGTQRRAHMNLSSADVDLSTPAGPDDTPEDPTDDRYGTDKILLWSQHDHNLGDESTVNIFGNSRSHRGILRSDFLVIAYAYSPNWSSARHGHDRYNFYVRRSFDGGQTWTTSPDGEGVWYCREYRTDPETQEPPIFPDFDPECEAVADGGATLIPAGAFEPARNISMIRNNKETSSDPRIPSTPPVPSLDGRDGALPVFRLAEDFYSDEKLWVAWGTGESVIATGGNAVIPEAPPLDIYYTRTDDWGDSWMKVPWNVNPQGNSENWEQNELVWRYDWLAKGDDEEQGEVEVAATPDASKMWAIWLQLVPSPEDPDAEVTRWYPWEPEETLENDIWFRRLIAW